MAITPEEMKKLRERYWSGFDKKDGDQCWEWRKAAPTKKHGKIGFQRKTLGTHRMAWIVHYGEIPPGLHVCHVCDNPPCVRIDHLWLGLPRHNNYDKKLKNRSNIVCIEQKLNKQFKEEIKHKFLHENVRINELARQYKVSHDSISYFLSRYAKRVAPKKEKISPEQRKDIVEMLKQGLTQQEIAKKFNVHRVAIGYIYKICLKKTKDNILVPEATRKMSKRVLSTKKIRLELIELLKQKVPRVEIAKKYGIAHQSVSYFYKKHVKPKNVDSV